MTLPPELIYDSAEGLRRADRLMDELQPDSATEPALRHDLEQLALQLASPAECLRVAHDELCRVLAALRRARSSLADFHPQQVDREFAPATALVDEAEQGVLVACYLVAAAAVADADSPEYTS